MENMTLKLLLSSLRFDKGLSGFCQNLLMGPLQAVRGAGVWLARLNSGSELEVEGDSNIVGLTLLGTKVPLMGDSPLASAVRSRGLISNNSLPDEWLAEEFSGGDHTYSAFPIQQNLLVRGAMMIAHGRSRKDLEFIVTLIDPLEIIASLTLDYPKQSLLRSPGNQLSLPQQLTERQLKVLVGLQEGLTNYQVARGLNVSESTVKHETLRIYRHFGVNNRADAISAAFHAGILELIDPDVVKI